jgi:hypothetical protein
MKTERSKAPACANSFSVGFPLLLGSDLVLEHSELKVLHDQLLNLPVILKGVGSSLSAPPYLAGYNTSIKRRARRSEISQTGAWLPRVFHAVTTCLPACVFLGGGEARCAATAKRPIRATT